MNDKSESNIFSLFAKREELNKAKAQAAAYTAAPLSATSAAQIYHGMNQLMKCINRQQEELQNLHSRVSSLTELVRRLLKENGRLKDDSSA
jgi:hypothetical protein